MGHHTCCNKQKVKRGLWSPEEDEKLISYISTYGHGCWSAVPRLAGLQRCGKSCRLRWISYLRPDLKRGSFSSQEAALIIDLHNILGNRWAQIAKHLPGRTDNEVKNFWNSSIKKKIVSHHSLSNYPNLSPFPNSFDGFLSQNQDPGFMFPQEQLPFIPTPTSVLQAYDQINFDSNSMNFEPQISILNLEQPSFEQSLPLNFLPHFVNHEPSFSKQEEFLFAQESNLVVEMPKLCDIINFTMPSSFNSNEVDRIASTLGVVSSSSGFDLYSPDVATSYQMQCIDAIISSVPMPSSSPLSSSSSSLSPLISPQFVMNPTLPTNWDQ